MHRLYEAGQIAEAVAGLAGAVAAGSRDEPILLLAVLKGALFVTADLARALPEDLGVGIDFVTVASYGSRRFGGEVRLVGDTSANMEGKHVVIVDGILDRGATLDFVERLVAERGPASLRSCVLLEKPRSRPFRRPDYVGLMAPDAFVVGYGLDYQEKYRNLPYLATLPAAEHEG
jgi:hypoxanthine phosphoribosyltransferase